MDGASIGHNRVNQTIDIELRLFNSLTDFGPNRDAAIHRSLPVGVDIGDLVELLGIPLERIFLVLVNGRDVTPTLGGSVSTSRVLEDGDRVALSGPVPYSWGYGAPVV